MSFRLRRMLSWRNALVAGLLAGGYHLSQTYDIDTLRRSALRPLGNFLPSSSEPDSPSRGSDERFVSFTPGRLAVPPDGPIGPDGPYPNRAIDGQRPSDLVIASWALGGFGPEQLADETVMPIFASVIKNFDIIALQQVRVSQRDFLPRLAARINREGRQYEYLSSGDIAGWPNDQQEEQVVFLFDSRRAYADRTQLYQVADPDRRLTHRPLVAWFRAAQADPRRAWTFSLVNVQVELARARGEVEELPNLINAVANDGRGEDDVILAGLFQADHAYLSGTVGEKRFWVANRDRATDVEGRFQTSNLIIDRRSTSESLLRGGVTDFLRQHNLSIEHAKRVSPYLPVHAEFSPYEG